MFLANPKNVKKTSVNIQLEITISRKWRWINEMKKKKSHEFRGLVRYRPVPFVEKLDWKMFQILKWLSWTLVYLPERLCPFFWIFFSFHFIWSNIFVLISFLTFPWKYFWISFVRCNNFLSLRFDFLLLIWVSAELR